MTGERPLQLQIVVASTRPERKGAAIAAWFEERVRHHGRFSIDVADLAAIDLPMFDEPEHPRLRRYTQEHTARWSARVEAADAFVFVTPEYNYGPPPALVNALDYLLHEWAYKPVGFVSYGGVSGGLRSVQLIKQIISALKLVPLPEAVVIPFVATMIDPGTKAFTPGEVQEKAAVTMLNELVRWADALAVLRR